jgi:hypothetical protein
MTPKEQYKADLAKWSEDIAVWQKAQKAWIQSIVSLSKNPAPNPGPAPRPPVPPPEDKNKLKDLLGTGNKPQKPVNPPPSGMPRPI